MLRSLLRTFFGLRRAVRGEPAPRRAAPKGPHAQDAWLGPLLAALGERYQLGEETHDGIRLSRRTGRARFNQTMVQDFVIFGHYDLDLVKKLLEREPALIYAAMDWGGGDFETALGGASHLGRRDIALYLIEKGARPDIFTSAMLGHADVIKSLLASHPTLIEAKGPHGIPLITHAKMGGKEAEPLYTYLLSLKKA